MSSLTNELLTKQKQTLNHHLPLAAAARFGGTPPAALGGNFGFYFLN